MTTIISKLYVVNAFCNVSIAISLGIQLPQYFININTKVKNSKKSPLLYVQKARFKKCWNKQCMQNDNLFKTS